MIVQFKDSGAENGSGSTTDVENNNAPANWGLTYTCDMANSITDGTALQIGVPTAIFLTPETINTIGCPTVPQLHTFILLNFTGAAGTFYLSYNVTTSNGSATGPVNVFVPNGGSAPFEVTLIPNCVVPGTPVNVEVFASGNGFNDLSTIN